MAQYKREIRWATAGVLATVGALLWFGVDAFQARRVANSQLALDLRVERLRGQIILLDEALTMSAVVAAASGDPAWSKRHESLELELKHVLRSAKRIAPTLSRGAAAEATLRANTALVEVEQQALSLAERGQLAEAQRILADNTYEHHRRIYSQEVRRFGSAPERFIHLEMLRGTIMFLDEALTMSAIAATESQDLGWAIRYGALKLWLRDALFEARELSDAAPQMRGAGLTERSNRVLVALEERAFQLVREGRAEQARALLSSAEYQQAKRSYAQGMDELEHELERQAEAALAHEQRWAWLKSMAAGSLMLILLGAWSTLLWTLNSNRRSLAASHDELAEKTRQLTADVARREQLEADLKRTLSDLERAQTELIQTAKLASLGRVAAGVAHEINNPLTGVLGISSAMLSSLSRGETVGDLAENLRIITRAGQRCRDIVAQLLPFARGSAAPRQRIEVAPALAEVLQLASLRLDAKKIRINVSLEAGLTVWGNDTELQQIGMNLVVNAVDAMAPLGELAIRGRRGENDTAIMEFQDTGTGIPPENIERVFEPFFTTKPPGQGTGLGLSVVHGMVVRSGGTIQVESSSRGTTFRLTLPCVSRAQEAIGMEAGGGDPSATRADLAAYIPLKPSVHEPDSTVAAFARKPERVLVLEDDEAVREVVCQFLGLLGPELGVRDTRSTADSREAIELIRAEPWDLLITDYSMQWSDGIEVARTAKAINPALRVIIMSGHIDGLPCASSVADGLLSKPMGIKEFRSAILEACGPRRTLSRPEGAMVCGDQRSSKAS